MKYELEKTRMWYEKGWEYTVIKQSDDYDELINLARSLKIKYGKTFEEKLMLNELDEYGDPYDVQCLKEFWYDPKKGLEPSLVDNIAMKDKRRKTK